MNICFLLQKFTGGGIGRVVSIVGNRLDTTPEFHCFGLCLASNGKNDIYNVQFPVKYIYDSCTSLTSALVKRHYIKHIRDYIAENRIDVIIACGTMFYVPAVLAARMSRIHVLCWEHSNPRYCGLYKMEKQCRWLGARLSDGNIVLTKQALSYYSQKYHNIDHQIYNPIDPQLDQRDYYSPKEKRIISVGRLCYQKNFSHLIEVAEKILPSNPDWHWDIYGEGEEYEMLTDMITQKGLQRQLHLCGQHPNLYTVYPEYRFIVMTSRFEGFPMTLLEAAANGLPMIAFDVWTGPAEIIRDGENGYLCSENDDNKMCDSIRRLMQDEELCKKMGRASRETAEHFTVERIIPQWICVLNNLRENDK